MLHIPHASTVLPDIARDEFMLSDGELGRELVRMTDWHTDVLFEAPGCHTPTAPSP